MITAVKPENYNRDLYKVYLNFDEISKVISLAIVIMASILLELISAFFTIIAGIFLHAAIAYVTASDRTGKRKNQLEMMNKGKVIKNKISENFAFRSIPISKFKGFLPLLVSFKSNYIRGSVVSLFFLLCLL